VKANNLFGVKTSSQWHGETFDMQTGEHADGKDVTVPATWRKYPNWAAAIADHTQFFFDNPRYHVALHLKRDPITFATAIRAAGYSTDPNYVSKIASIIDTHNLRRFDS
jgi:flagellum-specific peptidoglycan hydrolase FlgJ